VPISCIQIGNHQSKLFYKARKEAEGPACHSRLNKSASKIRLTLFLAKKAILHPSDLMNIIDKTIYYGTHMKTHKKLLWYCALIAIVISGTVVPGPQVEPGGLSAPEFAQMIRDFSEDGGHFFSDNFTSSEDSYLTIVDPIRQLGVSGGAYIGVGPEQNFTYIAKIRPRIAFIVDIRRQAMIQHLMYKAIFQLSPTPAQFLSRLLSRPMKGENVPGPNASLDEILRFFNGTPADEKTYAENLSALRKSIQDESQFRLSSQDQESLEYVYRSFYKLGFDIGFDAGGTSRRGGRRFGRFLNLMRLLSQKDANGKQECFLASTEDYDFVRNMQKRNLIIPIVGDFSGKKALVAVGDYLRKRGLTVSLFYVSNVEIVLLDWGSVEQFSDFARNVKTLPVNERSLLMRTTFSYYGHPAQLPGYQLCTFLQKFSVFVKDFDEGRYRSYHDLIMSRYLAAGK
jgi:hypothetical protein